METAVRVPLSIPQMYTSLLVLGSEHAEVVEMSKALVATSGDAT